MAYVVNQPSYPSVNGLKPDFYSLRLNINGPAGQPLYNGVSPVGLTSIDFSDKRESGKLRGNAAVLLAKTPGKYTVKASFEMYMADFYGGLLPFLGSLGLPLGLGAYELAFGMDLVYSVPGQLIPFDAQLVGASLGDVGDSQKEGQDPLKVKVELDEPFMLVRQGVIPMDLALTTWPTSNT